jgi:hypothetical protein
MFELLCAPILAILIIMRARAGRITPWMDIFWFIVMCFTAFAAMIFQGFRNLVCGTTPPVIEWKRGELPRLLDTRGGGWAQ